MYRLYLIALLMEWNRLAGFVKEIGQLISPTGRQESAGPTCGCKRRRQRRAAPAPSKHGAGYPKETHEALDPFQDTCRLEGVKQL
ncbi:hypothetical protein ACUSIJ_23950 [Pseudochelatococcus sp. B33]